MLTKENLLAYNQHRKQVDKSKVCHAPFVNLNFEQNGHVTACCFNRKDVLGVYPQNSLLEIWNGVPALEMRQKIESLDLDNGCKLCGILIESGNFSGSKAIHYDEFAPDNHLQKIKDFFSGTNKNWPKVFEFEISNTCNLECEMCSGYYSSTIRKNREKLPPIFDPYDDDFVHQLDPFLPYLTDMKFLGGEPFLIDRYYQIWEKVVANNPKIKIHITTNGTIFNQRVKNLLSKLKVGLIISIDSLDPQRYAEIRRGSQLDKVLKNVESFKEVIRQKNTYLTVAACVMSNNWMDLPDLLRYCNTHHFHLHFNLVWNPEKFSLRFLNYDELEKIEKFLSDQEFNIISSFHKKNLETYREMISTISHWKLEQSHTRLQEVEMDRDFTFYDLDAIFNIPEVEREMILVLLFHFSAGKPQLLSQLKNKISDASKYQQESLNLFHYLNEWVRRHGEIGFIDEYFRSVKFLVHLFHEGDERDILIKRMDLIQEKLKSYAKKDKIISDLLQDVDKRSFMSTIETLKMNDEKVLIQHLDTIYSE